MALVFVMDEGVHRLAVGGPDGMKPLPVIEVPRVRVMPAEHEHRALMAEVVEVGTAHPPRRPVRRDQAHPSGGVAEGARRNVRDVVRLARLAAPVEYQLFGSALPQRRCREQPLEGGRPSDREQEQPDEQEQPEEAAHAAGSHVHQATTGGP